MTDRLVPDFGFKGVYLPFNINELPHRAFVANDLKLNFLDAQNRLSKSLPAAASAGQKTEFKQLGTELDTLSFLRHGSIGLPGNQHGDPYTENDERLILFGAVPSVVYSEVVGEVDYFRTEVKQ